MFKKVTTCLVLVMFSTSGLANCLRPVTPLKKGEHSPCTGFLFSPQKELELRIKNEEYKLLQEEVRVFLLKKDFYIKEIEESEVIINKEREKAELWRKLAEDTTLKYTKLQDNRGYRDWLFLIGGVVLTVGSGYALGQAAK